MDIEQSTLIWIARIIFMAIFASIAYLVWRFMRRERYVRVPSAPQYQPPDIDNLPEKQIVIAVMAKPGRLFDMPRLFQVMHELGFYFARKIGVFEFLVPNSKFVAFSLVNYHHHKLWQFSEDPSKIQPSTGLVAIMQLPIANGDKQVDYFNLMVATISKICQRLDGELHDVNGELLRTIDLQHYQQEVADFELYYLQRLQQLTHNV